MRIGLDYLPAVCHAPGIGRYARELVRALVRLPEAPELRLFEIGGGERSMAHDLGLEGAAVRRYPVRLPRRVVVGLHRFLGLGADRWMGGVDLFQRMLPDYPPVSTAAEVLPLVELSPPGSPAESIQRSAARRAAAVLVFCEHYRREVARRFDLPAERIHRVPVGCDHWSRVDLARAPAWSPPRAPAASEEPLLLVLGALRRERHPLRILRAVEALASDGPAVRLVYVGRPGSAAEAFEQALAHSPVRERVTWIREPDESRMPSLVAQAELLLHLAEEEGSAVTPLEGFAAGIPVVASQIPAFEEALGPRAHLLSAEEADDPRHLAGAIEEALADARGPAGEARAEERRRRAAEFPWSRNAAETLKIWTSLHRSLGGS